MEKFTGFNESHVGCDVTDIIRGKGTIRRATTLGSYPIKVDFYTGYSEEYTTDGRYETTEERSLFFGHNIKVSVTGEKVPEPKLICPICGVEHQINGFCGNGSEMLYQFDDTGGECPFEFSKFEYAGHAKDAMRRLIEIIGEKQ